MRLLNHHQHPLLPLLPCCFFWAAPSAQYAWGPYNDDWKKYIVKPAAPPTATATTAESSPPRLMYRAGGVGGGGNSNGTTPSPGGNGTYYGYGGANATTGGNGFLSQSSPALSTSAPAVAAHNLTGSSVGGNSTGSSTNSSTIDTTCGVTSPLYTLQVTTTTTTTTTTNATLASSGSSAKNESGAASSSSSSSSSLDGWWLRLSGNSVLFTPQEAKATAFGVNAGTGHLCVPRRSGSTGTTGAGARQQQRPPLVAIVETRLGTDPVWFLGADRLEGYEPEYAPVVCKGVGGGGGGASQLTCSWGDASAWSGCGLQLALGDGEGAADGGLNCSSISISAYRS